MKNIKLYFKGIYYNSDRIQNNFLVLFQFIIWTYFATIHFKFFEKILYLPQTFEKGLGEMRVLEFPFRLNPIIFGGVMFTLFQLFRVLVNILTKRILFFKGANSKLSLRLSLIYLYVLITATVSFSSAITICNTFFPNEVQLYLENNLDLLFHENPIWGYLNPIVNSYYYYFNFVGFVISRLDFTLLFIVQFGFNMLVILLPLVYKIGNLKLRTTLKNKSNLDQITIFGVIQHELGNKLPTLKIDLEALNLFLKQESNSSNLLIERPIRKQEFEGDYVESVGDLLERIIVKVDYCINATSNLNGIINADPNKYNPKKVKLIEFFEHEAIKYIQNQPNITLEFVGNRSAEAFIDKKQFSLLLLNIISNAIMHGFTEFEKKYTLKFIIEEHGVSDFNGKFSKSIRILNNGNPFPKSIKKEEYGTAMKYGGNTGNSGYGGFLISKIIENHSGEFDIFDGNLNAENVSVGIAIYLP